MALALSVKLPELRSGGLSISEKCSPKRACRTELSFARALVFQDTSKLLDFCLGDPHFKLHRPLVISFKA